MDIIFNCPKCDQELEVDSSGAGSEIDCPNCSESIEIPQPGTKGSRTSGVESQHGLPTFPSAPANTLNPSNPIASSAAAKETDKKMRVKTIRHSDCVEVGHDKFDEVVTNFLTKIGETNIISITPLTYSHVDIGGQKLLSDYAVMIVYKG